MGGLLLRRWAALVGWRACPLLEIFENLHLAVLLDVECSNLIEHWRELVRLLVLEAQKNRE
jgi:hypothetical protein